jgi:hypothetical protein
MHRAANGKFEPTLTDAARYMNDRFRNYSKGKKGYCWLRVFIATGRMVPEGEFALCTSEKSRVFVSTMFSNETNQH